jgi:glyoxylase-like metal-dependent hydrolase (beta-lactamase superfamily II)
MIQIHTFQFNPFYENTFLVWENNSHEAMIIDPGCHNREEELQLADIVRNEEVKIKYLINTHCHIDHIFGNAFVMDEYSPEFFIPEHDKPLLDNAVIQAKMFNVAFRQSPSSNKYLNEDQNLSLGKTVINFLFTPGHTPGEFCVNIPSEKICFTGDVLFKGSIGRTDLWGGDYNTLIDSINTKLFTLDHSTKIYPGHGENSTIELEIKSNPFFK